MKTTHKKNMFNLSDILSISELLSSRLCHDIASPISAIHNGTEILAESSQEHKKQAIELITISAEDAVDKLRFFRIAYGKTEKGTCINLEDYQSHFTKYLNQKKISLNWKINNQDANLHNIPSCIGRLLINAVIFVASTMIYNSNISINIMHKNSDIIALYILGKSSATNNKQDLIEALEYKENTELHTGNIQAYYTYLLIKELDAEIFPHYTNDSTLLEIYIELNKANMINKA